MIFKSDFDIETIQQMGTDNMLARAAWVSTGKDVGDPRTEKVVGLLSFLMKNRHGTPFEHGSLTVRINMPIFLWREWHRHRVGFSYNEESARYKPLDPVFYQPGEERAKHSMKPEGFKPSKPGFRGLLPNDRQDCDNRDLRAAYGFAYNLYLERLRVGIDNGLARVCLPVGIYSACYVTANPRSIMHFLSLRVDDPDAHFETHPQWEMDQIARKYEDIFAFYWPITHQLWVENGRVAP